MFGKFWKQSRFAKSFMVGATALALAIGVGTYVQLEQGHAGAVPALPAPDRDPGAAALPASGSFAPVVKKVAPAVVSIQSERTAEVVNSPLPFFFGPQPDEPTERKQRGMGSGVIVSSEGYILTNHHVVEDADDVTVVLADEREFEAEIIGSDAKTDVAVLKIDADDLPVVQLGNSKSVEVGDLALAIGNPFGIGQTVTMGIVGATSREFGIMARQQGYEDFIQTDAAINPGNSGGALINTRGELIGINTAILSRSGGNNGVGFAVPINLAHHVMTQLVEKGRVVRGYMGVGIQDIDSATAKSLNAPDNRGVLVSNVEPGGPAEEAGFKQYDIIRKIEGDPIADTRELRLRVANTPPGETVAMTVLREGSEKELEITLGEFPTDEPVAAARGGESSSNALKGVAVENLDAATAQRLGLAPNVEGVVITNVQRGTPAAEAGLQPGMVIEQVDRKPVRNVAEFRATIEGLGERPALLMVTARGGSRIVVVESD